VLPALDTDVQVERIEPCVWVMMIELFCAAPFLAALFWIPSSEPAEPPSFGAGAARGLWYVVVVGDSQFASAGDELPMDRITQTITSKDMMATIAPARVTPDVLAGAPRHHCSQ
jgi:hypothetical protein